MGYGVGGVISAKPSRYHRRDDWRLAGSSARLCAYRWSRCWPGIPTGLPLIGTVMETRVARRINYSAAAVCRAQES